MSVEAIRAAMLGDLPHGFLGRRGGVSEGVCAGLNVGLGSSDERDAVVENRRRAVAGGCARRRLGHGPPGPFRRRNLCRRALARRCPSQGRRDRHRPARAGARHPDRRLHADPVRRPAGGGDRRRPCRLEGRVRRRDRIHARSDGATWRRPRPHRRGDRPGHRPQILRGGRSLPAPLRRGRSGQ